MSLSEQPVKFPGLNRMFVVNPATFLGRIEEIPIDAHTAIIAENGSGKTALIKLLPLFYGEEPRDVVLSYEQSNFFNFYLPTPASYIAFEYINHAGETRSVVMHADPSGSSLQYRFVRAPLSREMFLTEHDGEIAFVESVDLERRLRDLSVPAARRLVTSVRGYRSVIQGGADPTAAPADRSFHAELAQDYGLGTRRTPLNGIETLMMRMLRNDASLDTLLGIAAGQALDAGGGKVSILGRNSARSLKQWPKDYEGYRRVMALEGVFRTCEKSRRRVRDLEDEVAERAGAIAWIGQDVDRAMSEAEGKIAALRTERSETERADDEALRVLNRRISELTARSEALRDRISQIRSEGERLRKKGGANAAELVGQLTQIRFELEAAERHFKMISEGGRALAERYDQQRAEIITRFRAEDTSVRSEQEAAIAGRRDRDEEAINQMEDAISAAEARAAERLSRLRAELAAARAAVSDVRVQIAGVGLNEAEAQRVRELEDELEKARAQAQSSEGAFRAAREEEREARIARERAEMRETSAMRAYEAAAERHAALAAALTPDEGSFQHWLERNAPGWTGTIGKVIRPDLLSRRGLAPKLADQASQDLYGVALDLERLEPIVNPDLEARRQEAEKALKERDRLHEAAELARTELGAAVKRLDRTGSALAQAELAREADARRSDARREALSSVRQELGAVLEARKAAFGESLELAQDLASGKEAELSAATEEEKAERARSSALRAEASRSAKAAVEELRNAFRARLQDVTRRESEERDRLQKAHQSALQDAGLDATVIGEAEAAVARVRSRLEEAEAARPLAEKWDIQVRAEEKLPGLEAQERGAADVLRDLTDERRDKVARSEARLREMSDRIRAIEADQERLRSERAAITTILRAHGDPEPVSNGHVSAGFAVNASQLGSLTRALREARDALRAGLTEIRSGFRRCGNEAISDLLVDLREDDPEEMMARLSSWFAEEHQVTLGMLMRGISGIVTPIQLAYNELLMADREVSSIGRKLRRAIQDMPGFPHVTGVDLSIGCRLRDEPFWADLEAFDEALNAWQAKHDEERSGTLVAALTRLLEHWPDGREPVVEFRDMLFIEGRLVERGNERRFSRRTRLSELSSTGNVVILRLILFTALLIVMRQDRPVRFAWAVDEIGQLDARNTISLLEMLRANDIALVTAAPGLDAKVVPGFTHHLRIVNGALYRLPSPNGRAA